jgi:hypothetical protein
VKAELEAKVREFEGNLKSAQNERVAAERSLEKCQKELQRSLEANQQLTDKLEIKKVIQEIIFSSRGFLSAAQKQIYHIITLSRLTKRNYENGKLFIPH